MLYLEPQNMIGKGLHRECYAYPGDDDLCVKIIVNGDMEEHKREQRFFRLLEKRNIPWQMLPRYHGMIETNLGRGDIFDLIRDYDGKISKTLAYYLDSNEVLALHYPGLCRAFYSLKEYLCEYKIITMNLKPKNILYKKTREDDGYLVIVDSIGNSDFIPISNYIGFFAVKKILRKWQRFEQSILKTYQHNETLQKMLSGLD